MAVPTTGRRKSAKEVGLMSLDRPTVGFQKLHVKNVIPDPGAVNYCMHTFPEIIMDRLMYLDMGFKTLDFKLCEFRL